MVWLADVFRFTGRARRRTYWILNIVAGLVLLTGVGLLLEPQLADIPLLLVIAAVATLLALAALLAVSIRRLHDRNRSGWWMMLYGLVPALFGPSGEEQPLIPGLPETVAAALTLVSVGVSVWALVDLGILKGTKGANRFGSDPKGDVAAEVFS